MRLVSWAEMPVLELLLAALLAAAGAVIAWPAATVLVRVLALSTLAASAALALAGRSGAPEPAAAAPRRTESSEALGSGACRSCHPGEHASFSRSFHKTMTRLASAATVQAPFDGRKLEIEGRSVELSRRGDELWARLPDPDVVARAILAGSKTPSAHAPLVSRRVVLVTGSHHHEVYWVGGERGNELRLVPVTYLIAERRFVSRHDAFLQPPDAAPHAIRWNSNCIQCHTTHGRPGHDERLDRFASEAVELGIACEACHGPGAAHVEKHRSPFARWSAHRNDARDPTIVNPARLSAARSSDVCGQCHAYFVPRDEALFWTDGFATSYRPGDALEPSRTLVRFATARPTDEAAAEQPVLDAATESLFWGDGTIRVGGRELNGLHASACFSRGKGERQLACVSCHSMHDSEPDDQLRRGSVDAPCADCHAGIARRASEHTHHAPGSPGSSCVNCHMPFTSYALFKGIRSHRIDSPSAETSARGERPNACNLCHVDRTLAWTAEQLRTWYGLGTPSLSQRHHEVAATLEDLLAGDAAERAVSAWAFGREEAQRAAGGDFQARFLAELLVDPYSAVRKVACDSLRRQPGFETFPCDFVAAPEARSEARRAALSRIEASGKARTESALLFDARGTLEPSRLQSLLDARDDRPTTIAE